MIYILGEYKYIEILIPISRIFPLRDIPSSSEFTTVYICTNDSGIGNYVYSNQNIPLTSMQLSGDHCIFFHVLPKIAFKEGWRIIFCLMNNIVQCHKFYYYWYHM